jgi:aminopeptidase N
MMAKKWTISLGETYSKIKNYTLKSIIQPSPMKVATRQTYGLTTKKGCISLTLLERLKGKPRQIWTHGETETASKWFPTIDAPNQKSTQEIFITVDEAIQNTVQWKIDLFKVQFGQHQNRLLEDG